MRIEGRVVGVCVLFFFFSVGLQISVKLTVMGVKDSMTNIVNTFNIATASGATTTRAPVVKYNRLPFE